MEEYSSQTGNQAHGGFVGAAFETYINGRVKESPDWVCEKCGFVSG